MERNWVLAFCMQCELLYMHEASSTKSELQTLNLSDVKWNLQKILTEGSHLNDVDEVNIIVSFFAMKLASRNSATRYCARCCLTRLLTGDCEAAVTDFARTAIPENGGSAGGTIDPDSCEWLEMLDGAATKFLVIEALVPSLQLAIQIESNIHVVKCSENRKIGSYVKLAQSVSFLSSALSWCRWPLTWIFFKNIWRACHHPAP